MYQMNVRLYHNLWLLILYIRLSKRRRRYFTTNWSLICTGSQPYIKLDFLWLLEGFTTKRVPLRIHVYAETRTWIMLVTWTVPLLALKNMPPCFSPKQNLPNQFNGIIQLIHHRDTHLKIFRVVPHTCWCECATLISSSMSKPLVPSKCHDREVKCSYIIHWAQ